MASSGLDVGNSEDLDILTAEYEQGLNRKINTLVSMYNGPINRNFIKNSLKEDQEVKKRLMAMEKPFLVGIGHSDDFKDTVFFIMDFREDIDPATMGMTFSQAEQYCAQLGLQLPPEDLDEEYFRIGNDLFYFFTHDGKEQRIRLKLGQSTWLQSPNAHKEGKAKIATLCDEKIYKDGVLESQPEVLNVESRDISTSSFTLGVRPMLVFSRHDEQDTNTVRYLIPEKSDIKCHKGKLAELNIANRHSGISSNRALVAPRDRKFRYHVQAVVAGAVLGVLAGIGVKHTQLPFSTPQPPSTTIAPVTMASEGPRKPENTEQEKLLADLEKYFLLTPDKQRDVRMNLVKTIPAVIASAELAGMTPDNLTIKNIPGDKQSAIKDGKIDCFYKVKGKRPVNFSVHMGSGSPVIVIKP